MNVELQHISKRFGNVIALQDVSLTLPSGRVHGVLGENGAGKTTLMNILYGLLRPDGGSIRIDDRVALIRSPHDAISLGVGMVHQHFMLAGAMTVLDNILLGDRRESQWLDRSSARKRLNELADSLGLPIDFSARVSDLSVGQQQRVEILKALYRDAQVLILDEPTAVLTPVEVQHLFSAVRTLCAQGRAVVFISHKLGEIRQICDDLTVLRAGRVMFQGTATGITPETLSHHMVGRDVKPITRGAWRDGPAVSEGSRPRIIAQANSISLGSLRDATLSLYPGEILGIAGVDGNGQQELAEAFVGLRPLDSGRILFAGQDVTRLHASERFELGLAHIPNDRKHEGLVGTMSVAENLFLKRPLSRGGMLFPRAMRDSARRMIDRFSIRASSVDAAVETLSGGNAQKVILARELGLQSPRLLVAMNPARGLDVAATQFVYEQLLALRNAGGAVLLISSELDELLALCDRIAVLYAGRLTLSDFPRADAEVIGRLMTGAGAA